MLACGGYNGDKYNGYNIHTTVHMTFCRTRFPNCISCVIYSQAIEDSDIAPYAYTRGNFTTFKLVEKDFSGERQIPPGFSRYEFATVTDSLLTLYHGVKLHQWSKRSCHWSGRGNILGILPKVRHSLSRLATSVPNEKEHITTRALHVNSTVASYPSLSQFVSCRRWSKLRIVAGEYVGIKKHCGVVACIEYRAVTYRLARVSICTIMLQFISVWLYYTRKLGKMDFTCTTICHPVEQNICKSILEFYRVID